MFDLSQWPAASPLVHSVLTDPGMAWVKDAEVVVDVPPDADLNPLPEAQ